MDLEKLNKVANLIRDKIQNLPGFEYWDFVLVKANDKDEEDLWIIDIKVEADIPVSDDFVERVVIDAQLIYSDEYKDGVFDKARSGWTLDGEYTKYDVSGSGLTRLMVFDDISYDTTEMKVANIVVDNLDTYIDQLEFDYG